MPNISLTSVPHNTNNGVKQNVQNGNTKMIVVTFSMIEFTLFCLSVITIINLIILSILQNPCHCYTKKQKILIFFHTRSHMGVTETILDSIQPSYHTLCTYLYANSVPIITTDTEKLIQLTIFYAILVTIIALSFSSLYALIVRHSFTLSFATSSTNSNRVKQVSL